MHPKSREIHFACRRGPGQAALVREYWSHGWHCQPGAGAWVYHQLQLLSGQLFPPTCVLCLDPGQRPALDLCAACEADLPWLGASCPRCAEMGHGLLPCKRCRRQPPPFDRVIAAFHYDFPVAELIRDLKYRGDISRGRVLGTLLSRRIATHRSQVEAVLPVPLHALRERERGYNQALEIARYAARPLGLPVLHGLVRRKRATLEQAGLGRRARRVNLKDAFAVRPGAVPSRLAIVDDVVTTGATAVALASCLRAAGVEWIEVWAVARA